MQQQNGKDKEENGLPIKMQEPMLPSMEGNIENVVAKAEKFFEVQSRIRIVAIRLTNVNDWVNEDGKPFLQWTGASKIARGFGVCYDNPVFSSERISDDKGEYIVYTCAANVQWNGQTVPEIGTGSTRDAFFGKRGGEFLPLSEIDLNNVKKKALTNFLNRGLKSLLGLSYTWEEIEQITEGKISRQLCTSVKHSKGTQGGKTDSPETGKKREELWKMLKDICMNDEAMAKQELVKLTQYEYKGKQIPGKDDINRVSEKQVDYLMPNIRKSHESFMAKIAQEEQSQ